MKSTGYILDGKYYTSPPDGLFTEERAITDRSHDHDRQREEHRRDLIQPYKDGKPNPEFLEQYPEEAKQYGFNQGQQ